MILMLGHDRPVASGIHILRETSYIAPKSGKLRHDRSVGKTGINAPICGSFILPADIYGADRYISVVPELCYILPIKEYGSRILNARHR